MPCWGLLGDIIQWINMILLLGRWSWKGCSNWVWGRLCSAHSLFRSPRRWSSLSPYNSFAWKIVLKRPFVGDTGEESACTFNCSDLLGETVLRMGVLALHWLLFFQSPLWKGVVVLKGTVLDNYHIGRMWWSWNHWFWIHFTLGGCGGLEMTDFRFFSFYKGFVDLKGLICDNFHFGRI